MSEPPRVVRVVLGLFTALMIVLFFAACALLILAIGTKPAEAQSVDPLTQGVLDALDGKTPPPAWRRFCDEKVQRFGERGSPSANWPPLCASIAYATGEAWSRAWWLRYLTEARTENRLWGKEPGSSIYRAWIVMPVIVVRDIAWRRADPALVAEADLWLRATWTLMAAGACDAPERAVFTPRRWGRYTTSLTGARSYSRRIEEGGARTGDPHHLETHELDVIFARALGRSYRSGWDTWAERVDARLEAPADDRYGLAATERAALRRLVSKGDNIAQVLPWLYGSVADLTVSRYEGGAATYMRWSGGSMATAPGPARVCHSDGRYAVAAPDPGNRHDISPGKVRIEGGWLIAERGDGTVSKSGWPPEHPGRIQLPAGKLVYSILVGQEGVRMLGPPSEPPVKPPPEDSTASSIDWPFVARLARALERQAKARNPARARNRIVDAICALQMDLGRCPKP